MKVSISAIGIIYSIDLQKSVFEIFTKKGDVLSCKINGDISITSLISAFCELTNIQIDIKIRKTDEKIHITIKDAYTSITITEKFDMPDMSSTKEVAMRCLELIRKLMIERGRYKSSMYDHTICDNCYGVLIKAPSKTVYKCQICGKTSVMF